MAKRKKEKSRVGVLLGIAITPAKAQSIACFLNKCPYCVTCTNVDCTVCVKVKGNNQKIIGQRKLL